jgi:hypothetical protein
MATLREDSSEVCLAEVYVSRLLMNSMGAHCL